MLILGVEMKKRTERSVTQNLSEIDSGNRRTSKSLQQMSLKDGGAVRGTRTVRR